MAPTQETQIITSHDDVRSFGLAQEDEVALIAQQAECTFTWVTQDGSPMGVVMSYLERDGHFWLTGSRFRKRFRALARDPRALVVINSSGSALGTGLTVSYKGSVVLHEGERTKSWFYPALAQRINPHRDDAFRADFVRFLDTPNRIVVEFVPGTRVGFDGRAFRAATERSRTAPEFLEAQVRRDAPPH